MVSINELISSIAELIEAISQLPPETLLITIFLTCAILIFVVTIIGIIFRMGIEEILSIIGTLIGVAVMILFAQSPENVLFIFAFVIIITYADIIFTRKTKRIIRI